MITLYNIIHDAGWPIWPLLIASFIAVVLIIERTWSLRRSQILPPELTEDVLTALYNDNINATTIERVRQHSPLGQILASGLSPLQHADLNEASTQMQEAGKRVTHDLERYLSALGTIASVAPLLGLFGTVIGMIEIFASQDGSSGSPAALAHGISIALYNTAFGLIVAIPALIFWRSFRRRIDELAVELEIQATHFLNQAKTFFKK